GAAAYGIEHACEPVLHAPVELVRALQEEARRSLRAVGGEAFTFLVGFGHGSLVILSYRSAAAMLPPSTVVTSAVVLSAVACWRNACATSSAVTSRPSRLPVIYSCSLAPRAAARAAISSGVSRPERMRSALTALARIPCLPYSSAYCRTRNRVAAFGNPYGPKSTPRLTACSETLNSSAPPVPCASITRTAFCAT